MSVTVSTQDATTGERKVLGLVYQDSHVLIPKPQTYENLEQRARQIFNLDSEDAGTQEVSFYAMDLDICPGKKMMLHPDVWVHVGSVMCLVHVQVDESQSAAAEAIREGEMEEEAVSRVLNEEDEEMDEEPDDKTSQTELPPKSEPASSTVKASPGASSPAMDGEWSRSKQESQSRRTMHERQEGSQRVQSSSALRTDDTHLDRPLKTGLKRGAEALFEEPLSRSQTQSQPQTQSSRRSQPQSQSQSQSQQLTQSQAAQGLFPEDENKKLVITVTHPPSHQTAPFKAKAQTKVGKVIAGVCKSFGLDATMARLHMIIRADGDEEAYSFKCSREDTMAEAGAKDEARFIITVQGDPDH
ncbi:hypothetical protein CONPUDRAFT_165808 [Coniophora puteana RWD-64-598 SS2]|uniref:Uncharacterized protein n=1 Tax=Coniophora puteana (strain RWD-64-598) TaxID=741705 RepID=A0A5M3MMH7_CONPW|nr:uncharacterized protein CONPUDRAFT_165808 [Coniophora puteana RWD-64-598 SS2]EIW80220.1 hypothetical protein CONPUDRAFT_165808 [Coniophora puteana RWD-64-598 SS2]